MTSILFFLIFCMALISALVQLIYKPIGIMVLLSKDYPWNYGCYAVSQDLKREILVSDEE